MLDILDYVIPVIAVSMILIGIYFAYKPDAKIADLKISAPTSQDPAKTDGKNINYPKRGSEEAQKGYDVAKNTEVGDELEDLSWEFLYGMTENVMENFSEKDQSDIKKAAHTLEKYDFNYQHVIKFGLSHSYYAQRNKKQKAGGQSLGKS